VDENIAEEGVAGLRRGTWALNVSGWVLAATGYGLGNWREEMEVDAWGKAAFDAGGEGRNIDGREFQGFDESACGVATWAELRDFVGGGRVVSGVTGHEESPCEGLVV
jgi:hypothetical protein